LIEVPFLDVGASVQELRPQIDARMAEVLDRGWFVLGSALEAFEQEFADFVGARHCIGVGNGLDALTLALLAASVGPGDEVIVPAHTFIATWLAASRIGARPVPVDVDPESGLLDPERVADAMTGRTRAIVPVHLYGRPAAMPELAELARRHGVFLLGDAAQAHGASVAGRPIGAFGDANAWSFYPAKNLGALGDGGAVTTDDDGLASAVRRLRSYGGEQKYRHEDPGINSRLDEIQAAVLSVKLAVLPEWNARRERVAARYAALLEGLPVQLPPPDATVRSSWHLFVVRTPERTALQDFLAERSIATQVHYPRPPHLERAFHDLGLRPGSFPVAERWTREVLSLPMGPHLTEPQLESVVSAVRDFATAQPD
jgi:dTDP-4-amino-4,6-dideoxygalactose transaminase